MYALILRETLAYADQIINDNSFEYGMDASAHKFLRALVTFTLERTAMFLKAYGSTTDDMFRQHVKSFDASALPPCLSELQEHIRRTPYISQIWCNAHLQEVTELSPLDCGWRIDENKKYSFLWITGDPLPQSIDDVTVVQQNVEASVQEATSNDEISGARLPSCEAGTLSQHLPIGGAATSFTEIPVTKWISNNATVRALSSSGLGQVQFLRILLVNGNDIGLCTPPAELKCMDTNVPELGILNFGLF
ncbi:hypothetical protein FQA39_LY00067 [Lamprigera yunnana]|nr:hypothetical protein FQA39_LY00067 [Lamprigera yunnana]